MKYTILINVHPEKWAPGRGALPDDLFVQTWEDELSPDAVFSAPEVLLERIFMWHNADDRPDGQLGPSLSIGDVVILGERSWTCSTIGWSLFDVIPENVITDRPWIEVIRGEVL